jgi:hypothetical protein
VARRPAAKQREAGELAILATGVAIPGTAGWAERPIHGGGDYNKFMLSGSGLMVFLPSVVEWYICHSTEGLFFFPQRGFFLLA